jgi:hypothetical protein
VPSEILLVAAAKDLKRKVKECEAKTIARGSAQTSYGLVQEGERTPRYYIAAIVWRVPIQADVEIDARGRRQLEKLP